MRGTKKRNEERKAKKKCNKKAKKLSAWKHMKRRKKGKPFLLIERYKRRQNHGYLKERKGTEQIKSESETKKKNCSKKYKPFLLGDGAKHVSPKGEKTKGRNQNQGEEGKRP